MKDIKYAIIIPSYNNDHGEYHGKTYLRNCIESVLSQTYRNYYLIIVDDMSPDTSVKTIKEYMAIDDRIILIENKRKRYNGGSRNVGMEYALDNLEFDYFAFLDCDDWWTHNEVLEHISAVLSQKDYELLLIGLEVINRVGTFIKKYHRYDNFEDFFLSDNKVWCTAWARVIRKDKIVFFCEDTLMEDRVWSYRQADNCELENVTHLDEVCYTWNRMNTTTSVSLQRNYYWNASAWCHIGHQLQLLGELKHKDMIPALQKRIDICIEKIKEGKYEQY